MSKGFSLVEISVVLIIIALIFAGISTGNVLIKQAELRSITNDLEAYKAAYASFIVAYNKPPGDIDNATFYFPVADCEITAGACNGDGNGLILAATDSTDEVRAAMKHMAMAGLLNAYVPAVTVDNTTYLSLGTSAPRSKVDGTGYMMVNRNAAGFLNQANTLLPAFVSTDNVVYIGSQKGSGAELLVYGALNGYEAFNLDKKMDDAMSTSGGLTGASTGYVRTIVGEGQSGCLAGGNYDAKSAKNSCLVGLKLN